MKFAGQNKLECWELFFKNNEFNQRGVVILSKEGFLFIIRIVMGYRAIKRKTLISHEDASISYPLHNNWLAVPRWGWRREHSILIYFILETQEILQLSHAL